MNWMTSMFTGGAVIAVLVSFWGYIKMLGVKLLSYVFIHSKLDFPAGQAINSYCVRRMTQSRFRMRSYRGLNEMVRSQSRSVYVPLEDLSEQTTVYWQGWRPILFRHQEAESPDGTGSPGAASSSVSITTVRGLFDLDALIARALHEYDNILKSTDSERFAIFRLFGEGSIHARGDRSNVVVDRGAAPEAHSSVIPRVKLGVFRLLKHELADLGSGGLHGREPFDTLAYPPHVLKLVEEAKRWLASEDWYKARGVPWALAWTLYGIGGTGKTSLARATAQELDMPLFLMDLSSMSNSELVSHWAYTKTFAPCLILIEDLDVVFDGRENRMGELGGGLTFDCLLNVIDGVEDVDGLFLVITTNHIESIDAALCQPTEDGGTTRPGRVDHAIELGLMDAECRQRVADRILEGYPNEIPDMVSKGDGMAAAQFQYKCAERALSLYWGDKKKAS